ncbi:hypothetical protein LZC95_19440 [Pendulispora brunnea]|uniref:Uncharacterized protein n=1 Tax=Pendulispora brunnea TaxID=2905690 RepID=A0ABZ2KKC4_9BACT
MRGIETLSLFPDEERKVRPLRPTIPRGLVHIGLLAKSADHKTKNLLAELQRLEALTGGGLVHQLRPRGHHYVDMIKLAERFPKFLQPNDDEVGAEPIMKGADVEELRADVAELRALVVQLLDAVGFIRDLLADRVRAGEG